MKKKFLMISRLNLENNRFKNKLIIQNHNNKIQNLKNN
jgi:hypothetical protein